MTVPADDEDTPIPGEYPPTGRYRIKQLPAEVTRKEIPKPPALPRELEGSPSEALAQLIIDAAKHNYECAVLRREADEAEAQRRDKIEKENRFAELTWREEYDRLQAEAERRVNDRLDAQDARLDEALNLMTTVAAASKETSASQGKVALQLAALQKESRETRGIVDRLVQTVDGLRGQMQTFNKRGGDHAERIEKLETTTLDHSIDIAKLKEKVFGDGETSGAEDSSSDTGSESPTEP